MTINKRNKARQVAGRKAGRVFFIPPWDPMRAKLGLFYKQSYTYNRC